MGNLRITICRKHDSLSFKKNAKLYMVIYFPIEHRQKASVIIREGLPAIVDSINGKPKKNNIKVTKRNSVASVGSSVRDPYFMKAVNPA
jgi:hypothetical protein